MNFYPRPPRGGRQKPLDYGILGVTFLSTPSARRATRCSFIHELVEKISIHALREEGDSSTEEKTEAKKYFYPRPPRGGRLDEGGRYTYESIFLSTPSARRATPFQCHLRKLFFDFYPRPPRGGRPTSRDVQAWYLVISIHALREEGDSKNRDKISIFKQIIQHSARI